MVSPSKFSLERNQDFLEDNFDVFDPETNETHRNFSSLPECNVILLGETHYTSILHKIQYQFLERCPGKVGVLLETLPIGEKIIGRDIPHWENLPKRIEFLGSDVRHKITAKEYIQWRQCEHRLRDLELKSKKIEKEYIEKLSRILDDSISDISFGETSLNITQEIYDKATSLARDDDTNEREEVQGQLIKCNLGFEKGERHVSRSNNALAVEIIKASKAYSLVVGIWGEGHWYLGENLFKELNKIQLLKVIVLIPNNKLNTKVNEELAWRMNQIKRCILTLKLEKRESNNEKEPTYKITTTTFRICEQFKELFTPQIRKTIKIESFEFDSPNAVEISRDNLSVFKNNNRVVVPSNRPIKFVGLHIVDFESIQDALEIPDSKPRIFLINALDNMFSFINKSVESLECPQLDWNCYYEHNFPVVELSSPHKITFILSEKEICCSPEYILSEMHRTKKSLEVSCKTELNFRLNGGSFPANFYDWMNQMVPRVYLEVGTKRGFKLTRVIDQQEKPTYLRLSTNHRDGFEIVLLKKEESKTESKKEEPKKEEFKIPDRD